MNTSIKKASPDIEHLEKKMLKMEQAECPVIHSFGPGVYIRELRMKAGVFAIGHRQKKRHMNVFVKGKVLMRNDDGSKTELSAPMIFVGEPGRKAGYVLEDVVWLNIYATDETDIEKLEETFLDKSEGFKEHSETVKSQNEIDRVDFLSLIEDFGFDQETVRSQSECEADRVKMPFGSFKIKIATSQIEGKGIFATSEMSELEIIGPAKIGDKRTILGRYINHSKTPNAKMIRVDSDIFLIATRKIHGCHGGQDGEEITTDYRKNLKLIGAEQCQE